MTLTATQLPVLRSRTIDNGSLLEKIMVKKAQVAQAKSQLNRERTLVAVLFLARLKNRARESGFDRGRIRRIRSQRSNFGRETSPRRLGQRGLVEGLPLRKGEVQGTVLSDVSHMCECVLQFS